MGKTPKATLPSRLTDPAIFQHPAFKRAGCTVLLLFIIALFVQGCTVSYSPNDIRDSDMVPDCPPAADARAAHQAVSLDWVQDVCKRAVRS